MHRRQDPCVSIPCFAALHTWIDDVRLRPPDRSGGQGLWTEVSLIREPPLSASRPLEGRFVTGMQKGSNQKETGKKIRVPRIRIETNPC